MGGQACVLYGGAEFSRDADLALLCVPDNLERLRNAMVELQAEVIAFPDFDQKYLERGHAVHFRCRHPEATGLRIDVMARMRGVADFPELWERRTTIETEDGEVIEVMGIRDLVQAKKTQRDKDWPMIRRLIEAHYAQFRGTPTPERLCFWIDEMRTPMLLQEVLTMVRQAGVFPKESRKWLMEKENLTVEEIQAHLESEEQFERMEDRRYWEILKKEVERLRLERPSRTKES